MRYFRAALLGLVVAIVLGAATGVHEYVHLAGEAGAEGRARAYAESIAMGLNCAALFALVCVPVAVILSVALRRRSGPRRE